VPQTRKRAILIASLDGSVGPPEPTHQAYRNGFDPVVCDDLFGDALPPPVAMAQALGWNGAVQRKVRGAGMLERGGERPDREMDHPSQTITAGCAGSGPRLNWVMRSNYGTGGDPADRDERMVDEPAATVAGKIGRRIAPPGHRDREGGEPQFGVETVRVTVAEAGILQSFPVDYPWQGTKTQQYRCVGDAVPPLLARAILRPLVAPTRERAA
jgi:DNA (cytosine-5)-methyltransferase 1